MILLPPTVQGVAPNDRCQFTFGSTTGTSQVSGTDSFSKQVSGNGRQVYARGKTVCSAERPNNYPRTYSEGGSLTLDATVRVDATMIAYGPTATFPNTQPMPGPTFRIKAAWTNSASVSGPAGPTNAVAEVSFAGFTVPPRASANVTHPSDVQHGTDPASGFTFTTEMSGTLTFKGSRQESAGYYRAVYKGSKLVDISLDARAQVYVDGSSVPGRSGSATAEGSLLLRAVPILQRVNGYWQ